MPYSTHAPVTLGQIVFYTLPVRGVRRPAIVNRVWNATTGVVDLTVFYAWDDPERTSVGAGCPCAIYQSVEYEDADAECWRWTP